MWLCMSGWCPLLYFQQIVWQKEWGKLHIYSEHQRSKNNNNSFYELQITLFVHSKELHQET